VYSISVGIAIAQTKPQITTCTAQPTKARMPCKLSAKRSEQSTGSVKSNWDWVHSVPPTWVRISMIRKAKRYIDAQACVQGMPSIPYSFMTWGRAPKTKVTSRNHQMSSDTLELSLAPPSRPRRKRTCRAAACREQPIISSQLQSQPQSHEFVTPNAPPQPRVSWWRRLLQRLERRERRGRSNPPYQEERPWDNGSRNSCHLFLPLNVVRHLNFQLQNRLSEMKISSSRNNLYSRLSTNIVRRNLYITVREQLRGNVSPPHRGTPCRDSPAA
jgi:hypothetical protein